MLMLLLVGPFSRLLGSIYARESDSVVGPVELGVAARIVLARSLLTRPALKDWPNETQRTLGSPHELRSTQLWPARILSVIQ